MHTIFNQRIDIDAEAEIKKSLPAFQEISKFTSI